ncbi:MAG: M3 family metallopeptidase [Nitrosomonas sp.]|nr:MAG: M3 family metallopeptidase [Nitrosomonas sp.]
MSNPLLDFSGLPRFTEIHNQHITPAIETLLRENRSVIVKVRGDTQAPTWDNFVQPMVDASERLMRAWGQVSHLNAVMNNPQLREIYTANLPLLSQFSTEVAQDVHLFERYKQLRASTEFNQLPAERKRIIDNTLRDFRLGGAELPVDKKHRFMEIQETLSTLTSKFDDNFLDATNAYSLVVDDPEVLAGIPDDVLQVAKAQAEADSQTGWKFTLQMPSYLPVQQYARNRSLRETMYRAGVTRASEFDSQPGQDRDNMPLINEILKLRKEEAELLGYRNFAEVSLVTKMATSPQQVLEFLRELAKKARPYAERDLQELKQYAADKLGLATLEAWDVEYVSEKLREERYAFSKQEVKQYFPEHKVLDGMFRLVEKLYGLHIRQADMSRKIQYWHADVKLFDIFDANEQLIGQFYLDLYARLNKRSGAWMDDAITRRKVADLQPGGMIQRPVAYLTCNFSGPINTNGRQRPALFTHDEVIVLFHEFGHGLHHLLTKAEDIDVSGIHGVEWDAVELPSQFMENFCWEWDVVSGMSQHIDTGASLSRELFDKMLRAKNFRSGMLMLRQIEFALFDMHLHYDFKPGGDKTVMQLLNEIRNEVAVIIPPEFNRFPNSFGHIFAGGYAAGYYSYKWAEVLSADAYSMFEETAEKTVVNPKTGLRFWEQILAVGGGRPALESFIAFRGREPELDALLRHNGMETT